jgi:hypothetical protein
VTLRSPASAGDPGQRDSHDTAGPDDPCRRHDARGPMATRARDLDNAHAALKISHDSRARELCPRSTRFECSTDVLLPPLARQATAALTYLSSHAMPCSPRYSR